MKSFFSVIRKIGTDIAKKGILFRKTARFVMDCVRKIRFKTDTLGIKTGKYTVIFNSFNGRGYTCNPRAVYEYMLQDAKYKDFQFIWVFKEPEKYEFLKSNRNTYLVKYGTKSYHKAVARAKYWIFNYRVSDHIYPKKDQVYVQCWHGTPLKRLGYDLKNTYNVMNTTQEIYKKYKTDAKKLRYLLSPSAFATEKFISAWNLKAVNKENCVVQIGYPRNDFLFKYTDEDAERIKENLGLDRCGKKIILYAPTWRDNQHDSAIGYTYKTEVDFDYLQQRLGDDYVILFRAHYLVANSFDFSKYEGFVYDVSGVDDIRELYVVSDMLITDYSSVFFDYANLCRPILFYMYDYELYESELRGFYISVDELPGPIVKDEEALADEIRGNDGKYIFNEKYERFNKKYNGLEDGGASKRLVEECFR